MVWAVLDIAVWQGWPLLATTAEDAGFGETRRHRRSCSSKRPCDALDKEEKQ